MHILYSDKVEKHCKSDSFTHYKNDFSRLLEYVIQENTISEFHVQFTVTCHFFVKFTRKVSENYSKSKSSKIIFR